MEKGKYPLRKFINTQRRESIKEFENKQIDEDTFRNRARTKKQRDLSIN